AHWLGVLSGGGSAAAPRRTRPRPDRLVGLAVRSGKGEPRLFQHWRAGRDRNFDFEWSIDDQVERGLELAPQRRPYVRNRPILWRRLRDVEQDGLPRLDKGAAERIRGHGRMAQEAGQQSREQPMLVLGSLGP